MMTYRSLALLPLLFAVAACSSIGGLTSRSSTQTSDGLATEFAPSVTTTPLGGSGRSAASLDTTSAADKAAALNAQASGAERSLGKAVVALGPPAETGLWVQSVLIKTKGQGRVVGPNGQSLSVELRPGSGGALMSLSAYQALGLSLTSLPELTLFGA